MRRIPRTPPPPNPRPLEELSNEEAYDLGRKHGYSDGHVAGYASGSETFRARFTLVLGVLIGISIVGFILWMGK